jgi:hypothetical protein
MKTEQHKIIVEALDTTLRHLPQLVLKDVILLPQALEQENESDEASEELNNEAIELMICLMSKNT